MVKSRFEVIVFCVWPVVAGHCVAAIISIEPEDVQLSKSEWVSRVSDKQV